jgi:hypothetical protein
VSVAVPLDVAAVLMITTLDATSTAVTVVPEAMPDPETLEPTDTLEADVTELTTVLPLVVTALDCVDAPIVT